MLTYYCFLIQLLVANTWLVNIYYKILLHHYTDNLKQDGCAIRQSITYITMCSITDKFYFYYRKKGLRVSFILKVLH